MDENNNTPETPQNGEENKPVKKLSRFRARLCFIMLGLGLAIILVGFGLKSYVDWFKDVQYCGFIPLAVAFCLYQFGMKCPHCGHANPPQWSGNGTSCCKGCGKPLEYDK